MVLETDSKLLSEYIENSIDGILLVDLIKYNIIYSNSTFSKIVGIKNNKLNNSNFLNLIHPPDKKKFLNYIIKLNKINIRQKHFSIRILKSFKFPIEIELIGTLGVLHKKRNILIAIIRDISQSKRLENAFIQSTVNFKDISEGIDDAICILNLNGKFKYVSPRLPMILGGTDIPNDFFDLIHPEDINYIHEKINEGTKDKNKIQLDSIEFRILYNDSDYIWIEASIRKYFEGSNKFSGFLLVLRDIHDRKILEKRLEKSRLEIQEKNIELMDLNKIKSDFLSNASHELRTPLVSIKGFTEILIKEKSGNINKQQLQDLKVILRNTNRIIHLVNDLLDVSKLEVDKLILNKNTFNLIQLIKECIEELNFQIESRSHNILFDFPKDQIIITADNDRIHQLLINLLDNAIKYTPLNGKIKIHLSSDEKEIHFYIKDSGIGLTKNELGRIFKRFGKIYMDDRVDSIDYRGTGLGLVICKGIIEKHGGKIWALSEGKNKGSEFHFIIPKNNH